MLMLAYPFALLYLDESNATPASRLSIGWRAASAEA